MDIYVYSKSNKVFMRKKHQISDDSYLLGWKKEILQTSIEVMLHFLGWVLDT